MSERKRIPVAMKEDLLRRARYRCFLHRLAWIEIQVAAPQARKWRPLDIHHVRFRSHGGTDDEKNLVPVCPICHRIIHTTRSIGGVVINRSVLRREWDLWCSFDSDVPSSVRLGRGRVVATVVVPLYVYGLQVAFSVDAKVSYGKARNAILKRTVGVFASKDPHFPFPRGPVTSQHWETSADGLAAQGEWASLSAAEVFAVHQGPLQLQAPLIATLSRSVNPFLAGTDEQRTL
ncbi:HNH endonuclease [Sorangium sp. So ce764]|uniref:HNH endonuclease n=1 Tax=Sorangium sp. So ce764 TaxID=3133320 RepID=UPI003F5DCED4